MTYLTVQPTASGVQFLEDHYGRDAAFDGSLRHAAPGGGPRHVSAGVLSSPSFWVSILRCSIRTDQFPPVRPFLGRRRDRRGGVDPAFTRNVEVGDAAKKSRLRSSVGIVLQALGFGAADSARFISRFRGMRLPSLISHGACRPSWRRGDRALHGSAERWARIGASSRGCGRTINWCEAARSRSFATRSISRCFSTC